ncbi:MAG: glutamate--tRNA ligase [Vicingaceae bacterium]|jgi:glutamyl-tRNA synthetase|nr:glutamate--tRNA ligase [Vicingaceae bacterium]|tara:strand:- start:36024 stop:37556 length:1533 start_codon:yes stop_codon:yes gene_type:complete
MERKVRVRFAPSPTGPLHIGGVRTALYNYLFAKKHGGDFLLRIEDTDQTRYVKGAEDYILEALKWSGLKIDEGVGVGGDYGPYRQSERKEAGIYKKYVDQLLTSGHAYYAFDTPEELEEMRENLKKAGVAAPQYNINTRNSMKNSLSLSAEEVQKRLDNNEPYVVRIKIPRNEEIKFKDLIRGWVIVQTTNLDDKVLYKSDGMPTYHMANIVDDYLMKITHVIRGEEWLPSGPLHVLLYQYLGWEDVMPQFAHLPLILKPDGNGKLSKRDGDRLGFPVFPIQWTSPEGEISSGYKESGYFPDAFINMLALLGWNPGTTQEIFSMEELIQAFSLEKVGKSGSKFDPEKTRWFNAQYLRNKSNEELAAFVKPLVAEKGFAIPSDSFLSQYCGLMKERAVFINDLLAEDYLFVTPTTYDEQTINKKWKAETPEIIKELRTVLENIVDFNAANIEIAFKSFIEEKGLGFGAVLPNFRVLVTGMGMGPSMFEICALLGKEDTLRRIDVGLQAIAN